MNGRRLGDISDQAGAALESSRSAADVFLAELEAIEAELAERCGADRLAAFKTHAAAEFAAFLERLEQTIDAELGDALRETIAARFGAVVGDIAPGEGSENGAGDPDAERAVAGESAGGTSGAARDGSAAATDDADTLPVG
jgi:hypothetical protein